MSATDPPGTRPGAIGPRETRRRLDELGLRPNRKLGQNFLVDGNLVRKSIAWSQASPGDRIVEVGPGLGTLTEALLETGAEVFAIEKDARLAGFLRDRIDSPRFHLLQGDAVASPRAALPSPAEPFLVVANLPYAIATPWLSGILDGPLPERMVLLVQKEAAERWMAKPGTKQRGAISIRLRACFSMHEQHHVRPTCFLPPPEVDSTLISLRRKEFPKRFRRSTLGCMHYLFQKRRKQIRSSFDRYPILLDWLESSHDVDLKETSRPEQVADEAWVELNRIMPE